MEEAVPYKSVTPTPPSFSYWQPPTTSASTESIIQGISYEIRVLKYYVVSNSQCEHFGVCGLELGFHWLPTDKGKEQT